MRPSAIFQAITTVALVLLLTGRAEAMASPDPLTLYDKGSGLLAQYQGQSETLIRAEHIFQQLINHFPDSPFGYLGMSRAKIIEAYRYGHHYNMKIIRESALPNAVKALEMGPSLRAVHENYGVFEQIFNEYNAHQAKTQKDLTFAPNDPKTYFEVANFVGDLGEFARSIDYFKVALEMTQENDNGLRLKILKRIAWTYLLELDSPQKAAQYYQQALKIRDNSPEINEDLGRAYLQMKKYRTAVRHLKRALSVAPNTVTRSLLMEAKGYLSQQEGKTHKAIDYLEKAAALDEGDSTLHFDLGNLYYSLADYGSAYAHFKQAIDLHSQNSNAYYYAGRSADSLGERALALDYYMKYLQLDSDSQEAQWIRENKLKLSQP